MSNQKSKKTSVGLYMAVGIILLILGGVVMLLTHFKRELFGPETFATIAFWIGVGFLVFGVLMLLVALVEHSRAKKARQQQQEEIPTQPVYTVEQSYGPPGAVNPQEPVEEPVRYIPNESVYQYVQMGSRQSTEEKFNEISKMDKTQFVIYIARMFSHRGYQVKFTPVIDNYNIDLLVEKMGVIIAVGCIHTTKVLCEQDIRCVVEGSRRYPVHNVMTLTNMYFDHSAVEYAKRERMSLVDRNILAEDFMR